MKTKEVWESFDILAQCRRYHLGIWQCPQFLFLVMGIIIVLTSVGSFIIGTHYVTDPALVALFVLMVASILLVIAFLVIRSFERLAEANRLKSEFVGIVSHQLRAPLSNLKWAIEILMSERIDGLDEKQSEYAHILRENIGRMNKLISDLLIASRIETENMPLAKEDFDLAKETEKIVTDFKHFARAANVVLNLETEPGLPLVWADPEKIRQVIENLLDNAVRYIKGRGEVRIRLFKKDENLVFEIRDTGVGIPLEDQPYIFQRFFRSKNIMRQQTQGSGLGLFIAKSIIERSGGKIGFESRAGKGTAFYFTLPIK